MRKYLKILGYLFFSFLFSYFLLVIVGTAFERLPFTLSYKPKFSIVILATICMTFLINRFDKILVDKKNVWKNVPICIIFIFIIFLPLIFITSNTIDKNENRNLAKFPSLFVKDKFNYNYFKEIDAYFSDHYGFRDMLIKNNSILNVNYLRTSSSNQVLLGSNGWLYYSSPTKGEDTISTYQHINLFTDEELVTIKDNLLKQEAYCKQNDSKFLLVITPNKETIYKENYPKGIAQTGDSSRTDQLAKYIQENTDINFVYLKDKLLSSKSTSKYPLYLSTDTHWNRLGGFYGYEEIMKHLNLFYPNIKAFDLSDYTLKSTEIPGGDLAKMINMQDYYKDTWYNLVNKNGNNYKYIVGTPNDFVCISQSEDKTLPTMVMFRDSFAKNLAPYLSNHFSKIDYEWSSFNKDIISKKKPNIVIYELTERFSYTLLTDFTK